MSNIDETAKTLILNTIQNVFTESAIEEPIVEETPAEKLRREVAEKIAHEFDVRGVKKNFPVRLLSGGNMQKLILYIIYYDRHNLKRN